MTPEQLRAVAQRIRSRRRYPDPSMTPTDYLEGLALHTIADALDEQATAEET